MKNNEAYELGKIPPQAIDIEEAVLGALMLEQEVLETVKPYIDTQSFYKDEHQAIFQAIKEMYNENKTIDLLTVTRNLKDSGKLTRAGGPAYITNLTRKVSSAANIESYAKIIAEKCYKRKMIRKASEILTRAYGDEDVEELETLWKKSGEEMESIFTVADTGSHIREVLKNTLVEIEQDYKRFVEKQTPGIPTGFASLDDNTGGWRGGNLVVLAARPNVGKTSFALFFALEAAKAGYWVNIFSLEMNKEDLARIILAGESRIHRSYVRDGFLQDKDWEKLNHAITKLEKLPIIFRDANGMNVTQIEGAIRKNRKNGKCDFAIVDYLQLIKSSGQKAIRELEVSEISRSLKTAALAQNIPIMALSQLNRMAETQKPKLSHLRESGSIEQDADIVCFLHKPDENSKVIRFIVAKHRRGRKGEIDIYCNDEMTKSSEMPIPEIPNKIDVNRDITNQGEIPY